MRYRNNVITQASLVVSAVVGLIITGVLISFLLALPVMWTWNYVLPSVLGVKPLLWTQAWCLMFLTSMLFKSSTSSTSKS